MRKDIIKKWEKENATEVTEKQLTTLEAYQNQVLKVNQTMNLTAITTPEDFAIKHIIDSLTLLPYIPENACIIDIGTGAGFPGIVLKIMREDINLTLLDSLRKRVNFLQQTTELLNLQKTNCIHARAEDHAKTHPAHYEICTARAVASMDKLTKYALPLVKKDGAFLAMKGPEITEELEKAKPALAKKGGTVEKIAITEIAEGIKHSIVVIRKVK
jgi:16S rRNA (guanine527-N7)-methyltransferase